MAVQIGKEQIKNNAVDSTKLDGSSNYSFSGQMRYTGSDADTQALATRGYVDSVAAGLDPKDSCKVTTTGNITLSGTQTIDGVSVSAGDRVLVKDQSAAGANGIYIANASAWTRSSDMAVGSSAAGASMFIEQGTLNGDMGFVCTSNKGSDVVGTDSLSFSQYTGASNITAGLALSKTGDTLNVETDDSTIEVSADALQLKDAGITNVKIADGTISNGKLVNSSISGVQLGGTLAALTAGSTGGIVMSSYTGTGAVNDLSINLDGGSLTTSSSGLKVDTNGIATLMIQDDAITSAKLADGSVLTASLAALAVTDAKLAANAVVTSKINDGAVTSAKIAADAIDASKIADAAVQREHLNANVVNAAGAVVLDGTNNDLKVNVDGASIEISTNSLSVKALGIATGMIQDDAITQAKIADAAVGGSQLEDGSVSGSKVVDSTLASAKLNFVSSYETLTAGNGSLTTFDTSAAADGNMLGGSIVFRNGLAMGLVASSPSGQDQYSLSATGGTGGNCRVTFGTAPNSGDQITIMYFSL
tara:strand:+ start:809 stop:2407 length:1599 start_codon:yes stop_codon:yes gene_type:complete